MRQINVLFWCDYMTVIVIFRYIYINYTISIQNDTLVSGICILCHASVYSYMTVAITCLPAIRRV